MEVYDLNFDMIREILTRSKVTHFGDSYRIIPCLCGVIKMHENICKKILDPRTREKDFYHFIRTRGTVFSPIDEINEQQIEYLEGKRYDIKLTKMPRGILYSKDLPIATVLDYHRNYHSLHFLEDISPLEFHRIVSQVLEALRELENNEIYHLDLNFRHVLYNGAKPEIISLDGKHIKYGVSSDQYSEKMYEQFAELYLRLIYKMADISFVDRFSEDETTEMNYEKAQSLVKKLEGKL